MTANTNPIFSRTPDVQWAAPPLSAANTSKDGTTGTIAAVFAADATEGGRIEKIIARPLGTNVATVLRVFLNNGGGTGTAANNALIAEMTLPATTLSEAAAQPAYELALNLALPPGYAIFCTIGTAVAAGYMLSGVGSKY
jgi:hypothetical protein